jgi:hypothetical protein
MPARVPTVAVTATATAVGRHSLPVSISPAGRGFRVAAGLPGRILA